MVYINIVYENNHEYSYMVPRIDPAKIEQLKMHPGVKAVKVIGNSR